MLRFTIGRIPVGIHFSFLLIVYFAYTWTNDVVEGVIASLGVLAAIITHEMGHALTARRFGADNVSVTLFALGGVTTYPVPKGLTAGRRFLIAAAGSALAIVASLPFFWALRSDLLTDETLRLFAGGFVIAGLVWGLINWAPIRPLDGGQMLTSALQIVLPKQGATIAKVVSVIVTAGAAFWLYQTEQPIFAFYVIFIGLIGLRDDPTPAPQQETGTAAPRPHPPAEPTPERPPDTKPIRSIDDII